MNSQELKDLILEAFEKEQPPHLDQIAPHPCAECDELARDLNGRDPSDVPLECLEYHRWDLPLLSAQAKRYFLPAWMIRSIDDPASDFTDALILNFDSDHRQDGYTGAQKATVLSYLHYIRDRGDEVDRYALESAERRWT